MISEPLLSGFSQREVSPASGLIPAFHTQNLSWPAQAGHPGETCDPQCRRAQVLVVLSRARHSQLAGPLARAMTAKGKSTTKREMACRRII
jgi:hypothetical protein